MNEISNSIINYINERQLLQNTNWYNWSINENLLPNGIQLEGENLFQRNLDLKYKLSLRWENVNNEERYNLIRYYIKVWGGIRKIADQRVNEFNLEGVTTTINRGVTRISSWSKALVVKSPDNYAIYDSRVAISINCLQILNNNENPIMFPLLLRVARNNIISQKASQLNAYCNDNHWANAGIDFYEDYIRILRSVANNFDTNIATIEMLLFAEAEVIARDTILENL
jgi:hypothetical protein